jgi:enediyne polyketide synthase
VHATERLRNGNSFLYDLEITDADGRLLERWEGLHLRAVELLPSPDAWPEALFSPYLERRLEELVAGTAVKIAFKNGVGRNAAPLTPEARAARSDAAFQYLLGRAERIWRRPDGKPLCASGAAISSAHSQHFTLAIVGQGELACDLEEVRPRSQTDWQNLLGPDRLALAQRLALEKSEPLDHAATRLWSAGECLKKSGSAPESPLVLQSATDDGWVLLRAGAHVIASYVAPVNGNERPLAVAIALDARENDKPLAFAQTSP